MKQKRIIITYSESKLSAIEQYLKDGKTIEDLLNDSITTHYEKTVPKEVRSFIGKMLAPKEPASGKENTKKPTVPAPAVPPTSPTISSPANSTVYPNQPQNNRN